MTVEIREMIIKTTIISQPNTPRPVASTGDLDALKEDILAETRRQVRKSTRQDGGR